jgi:hypothetical protein
MPGTGSSSPRDGFRGKGLSGLLANDVDDDLPRMRASAMLEKVNALPRAEQEAPTRNRNCQRCLRQRALDVCGHVVGTLGSVYEERIALRHQVLEKGEQISLDVGIGVLLYQQGSRGMPAENVCQPRRDP